MHAFPKGYGAGGIRRAEVGVAGGGQQTDQGDGKAAASVHHPEGSADPG